MSSFSNQCAEGEMRFSVIVTSLKMSIDFFINFRILSHETHEKGTITACQLSSFHARHSLKDEPLFPTGGGEVCILGLTQMAISWVWGVRGGQIFFCYELWTHWDPLGVRPAPKSICTHQAHPLKLVVPKMAKNQHFGSEGMTPPDGPKYFSVRIRSRNVLSGPSLIK